MIERFICIDKWGKPFDGDGSVHETVESAQEEENVYEGLIAGIIRIVVENGKIKHCHEVGSVDP